MADRGRGGRGRGRFSQQPFPNRGRGDGGRGGRGFSGDRGRGFSSDRGDAFRGDRGRGGSRGGSRGGPRGGRGGSRFIEPFKQDDTIYQPSEYVTKLENESFNQDLSASLQHLTLKDKNKLPRRPAYGTKGKTVTLWANYFELIPPKDRSYHRYDVSFALPNAKAERKGSRKAQGDATSKSKEDSAPKGKKLERCMRLLLKELPNTTPLATDYKSTIIASQSLPYSEKQYTISYFSEDENGPGLRSPKYVATVKHTGNIAFGDLLDYLQSTDLTKEDLTTKEAIIQITNIIIASGLKANSHMITKKNKYFPAGGTFMDKWMLATGLEAFRGFFVSVRAATGRVLMNMQVQHVVVWEAQPMLVLLRRLIQYPEKGESGDIHEVSRLISGVFVRCSHLKNRLKKVAGLAQPGDGRKLQYPPKIPRVGADATEIKFWKGNPAPGEYVTVKDCFATTYRPLSHPNAPLLNVGTKDNPSYMPSELCTIKQLQTYDKKLSPDATAKMMGHAVRDAPENARTIASTGLRSFAENSLPTMKAFGIGLNPMMITVNARVLAGMALQYQGRIQTSEDGSWNMTNVTFSQGTKIPKWSYMCVKVRREGNFVCGHFADKSQVEIVMKEFRATLGRSGVMLPEPAKSYELDLANTKEPDREVDQAFSRVLPDIRLLLVMLPNKDTSTYNAVKRAGDIKYGIHTVCVVADKTKFCKSLFPGRDGKQQYNVQYYANVALKINLKFGGCNQALKAADLGFVSEGKTMLIGLDVTHPAPGSSEKAPSVSSITASVDSRLGQWPADVAIQKGRQEMIDALKNMVKSRLLLWQKANSNRLPEEIIVYRDGVGESMYEKVRNEELSLIRQACNETYPATETKANKPWLTIIICGKRHHTRFFPTDQAEADPRTGGPKSGTIVDRGVTEARSWDFYLQAHAALKGTPRSAHYVVIHDEIFRRRAAAVKHNDGRTMGQRAADDLEQLTHAISYMYGRATKAVSLCTPAYYADIACEHARAWLSRLYDGRSLAGSEDEAREEDVRVHERLRNTMFYI